MAGACTYGEREKDEMARRDRFFAGMEIGIHRLKNKCCVKISEFDLLKWSYFLLAQNSYIFAPKMTLSMLAEFLRRAGEREIQDG